MCSLLKRQREREEERGKEIGGGGEKERALSACKRANRLNSNQITKRISVDHDRQGLRV